MLIVKYLNGTSEVWENRVKNETKALKQKVLSDVAEGRSLLPATLASM